jgi:hypothetical protein
MKAAFLEDRETDACKIHFSGSGEVDYECGRCRELTQAHVQLRAYERS